MKDNNDDNNNSKLKVYYLKLYAFLVRNIVWQNNNKNYTNKVENVAENKRF